MVADHTTLNGAGVLNVPEGQELTLTSSVVNNTLNVSGTVVVRGSTTVNEALSVAPGALVQIRGDGDLEAGSLTVTQPWTNHGTVEFTSVINGQEARLFGGQLTNAADGTVEVLAGTGGGRLITAPMVNQ